MDSVSECGIIADKQVAPVESEVLYQQYGTR
jgi:hypothetical protein